MSSEKGTTQPMSVSYLAVQSIEEESFEFAKHPRNNWD
jgi:hypothetical protein